MTYTLRHSRLLKKVVGFLTLTIRSMKPSRYHHDDHNNKNKSRFSAEEEENEKKSDRWGADNTLNSFTDFFLLFCLTYPLWNSDNFNCLAGAGGCSSRKSSSPSSSLFVNPLLFLMVTLTSICSTSSLHSAICL